MMVKLTSIGRTPYPLGMYVTSTLCPSGVRAAREEFPEKLMFGKAVQGLPNESRGYTCMIGMGSFFGVFCIGV